MSRNILLEAYAYCLQVYGSELSSLKSRARATHAMQCSHSRWKFAQMTHYMNTPRYVHLWNDFIFAQNINVIKILWFIIHLFKCKKLYKVTMSYGYVLRKTQHL